MKRYEVENYRVDVDRGLARVFRFISKRDEQPHWIQVQGSPYHLPVLDFELSNPASHLTAAVAVYELTTGRTDLRYAISCGQI